jgi:hypothetical protein
MDSITVMPAVLIQRFVSGAKITGVSPIGTLYSFAYDNEASGPFVVGEGLSWTGGTGGLSSLTDNGTTGLMSIILFTGTVPVNNSTITGADSSATCDVNGIVTSSVSIVDTVETKNRGRIRKLSGLTDGGFVDIDLDCIVCGYRVTQVLASLPGISALSFFVDDYDDCESGAGSVSLSSGDGYIDWRNNGVLVPPGFKFRVVGTGELSDVGQIMFVFSQGWQQSGFEGAAILGMSNSPPVPVATVP